MMAATTEQNVLLHRRQITPQNSNSCAASSCREAKTICSKGTGSLETISSAGQPGPNPGTNLWTGSYSGCRALWRRSRVRGHSTDAYANSRWSDFSHGGLNRLSRPPGDFRQSLQSAPTQTRRCQWAWALCKAVCFMHIYMLWGNGKKADCSCFVHTQAPLAAPCQKSERYEWNCRSRAFRVNAASYINSHSSISGTHLHVNVQLFSSRRVGKFPAPIGSLFSWFSRNVHPVQSDVSAVGGSSELSVLHSCCASGLASYLCLLLHSFLINRIVVCPPDICLVVKRMNK